MGWAYTRSSAAEALAKQYPHRERVSAQLMLCLYRCGRQVCGLPDTGIGAGSKLDRAANALSAPATARTSRAMVRAATGTAWARRR